MDLRILAPVSLLLAAVAVLALVVRGRAQEEDNAAKAAAALTKAVEEGGKLFRDPAFGTNGKSCATCHEDPSRPKLALASRAGDYPKWDRREETVITLGQKIRQMAEKNLKGTPPALGDPRVVALEAYVMSLVRSAR